MVNLGLKLYSLWYSMPGSLGDNASALLKAYVNGKTLNLTAKANDSGLVGVFSTGPNFNYKQPYSKNMRRISTTIKLFFSATPYNNPFMAVYGGMTIVKL
jgi:hypothetical protein